MTNKETSGLHLSRNLDEHISFNNTHFLKAGGETKVQINLDYPDSFNIGWPTNLSVDEFLKHASDLIDKVSSLSLLPRLPQYPNPAEIISSSGEQETILVPPSYSGFGVNNIYVLRQDIEFSELEWPLNKDNIQKVATRNGSSRKFSDTNIDGIRINAQHCSVLFNDNIPFSEESRVFSFWSHVPALPEISEAYQKTAVSPVPRVTFETVLNTLIVPRFLRQN